MKYVLVIAYYFPPSGGPGVQRVLKHIQYLREFGWMPVVLTVSDGDFPARDESLLNKIPSDVHVERVQIFEPYAAYRRFMGRDASTPIDVNVIKKEDQRRSWKERIAEWVRATFFIPDARIAWLRTAVPAGRKLIKQFNIQAVYSSSPPYTASLIGRRLHRAAHLPWVAGLRDPWTDFLTTPERWWLPAMIDRMMEHRVLRDADFVECAWEGIKQDALRKYPHLPAEKFIHVPNGYDSSDFPGAAYGRSEKFVLTYTGSMYGRRNPRSLFDAIQELIDEGKVDPRKLHLRFVGRFGDEVKAMFNSASFSDRIEEIGYVPHAESIAYLMQSDALLLVVDEAKESEAIVPGKVYEYIGVRRPVLAVAPDNSAIAQLLNETRAGRSAHQSDIVGIKQIFLELYTQWQAGENMYHGIESEITRYERRESARQLAGLLDRAQRDASKS